MNPTLAALYGTGMDKVAHDEISDDELLMALLEEEEKTASSLEDLDDETLVALYDELEAEESGDGTLNKMASSGDLEYWDMAGRVMAHAYSDEFDKVAGAEDDFGDYIEADYVDLNELDADDLYELAMHKEASMVGTGLTALGAYTAGKAMSRGARRVGGAMGRSARSAGRTLSRTGRAVRDSRGVQVGGAALRGQAGAAGRGVRRGMSAAANTSMADIGRAAVRMGNKMIGAATGAAKGTAGFKAGKKADVFRARGLAMKRMSNRLPGSIGKRVSSMGNIAAGQLATRLAMGGAGAGAGALALGGGMAMRNRNQ
jgi:hypothetical protein